MTTDPDLPVPVRRTASGVGEPRTAITPTTVSPVARAQAAESDDLAAMQAQFHADFVAGKMGVKS